MPARRTGPTPQRRLLLSGAAALALAGCGGGVVVGGATGLRVGITAGVLGYAPVGPGPVVDVVAPLGQPVAFDASEPVVWRFTASGSALFVGGTVVTVGGVSLRLSQLTPSRAVVETTASGLALLPLVVLLTATSTFDAAQVATVRLRIG